MNAEQIRSPTAAEAHFGGIGKDFRLIALGVLALLPLIAFGNGLGPLQPLRLILGLAYVLYIPGYCLTAALFAHADDLDGIERTGLSLGLSVAWVSVLALILDWLPWGLRLWPIVFGEMASIGVFAAVALWRRPRLPAGEAYAPDMGWRPRPWWRSLPVLEKRIYLLVAVALVMAGVSAAWVFLVPSPAEFMTEFYMLGKEGLAEDYPREAAVGEPLGVTLGVTNRERGDHAYRVEVWAVDPWAEDRRQLVATDGPLFLVKDENHEWPITWVMPWAGDDQVVEVLLFHDEGPEVQRRLALWLHRPLFAENAKPYRQLRLWLNVTEAQL